MLALREMHVFEVVEIRGVEGISRRRQQHVQRARSNGVSRGFGSKLSIFRKKPRLCAALGQFHHLYSAIKLIIANYPPAWARSGPVETRAIKLR